MAETPKKTVPVRYRVRARTFVNGNLYDPDQAGGKPVFVMAAPGLAGKALEECPDGVASAAPSDADLGHPARENTPPPKPLTSEVKSLPGLPAGQGKAT